MDKIAMGEKIKRTRLENEMVQRDIAEQIGVAISTIQRYEAGTIVKPKMPVIEAIARALNVNPAWLIGKSDKKEPAKSSDGAGDEDLSENEKMLIEAFRSAPETTKEAIRLILNGK